MIDYEVENIYEIREEMEPLNIQHYADDYRLEGSELAIDWDRYKELTESGNLLLITARSEGKLVGYMLTTVTEHLHTKGFKLASMDAMFVATEYRGEGIASELVETTEDILTDQGVTWFTIGFRDETVAKAVTEKYGYEKVEVTFGKTLRKS